MSPAIQSPVGADALWQCATRLSSETLLRRGLFREFLSTDRLTKNEKRSATITTQSLPSSAAAEILDKQRLLRPSSPHFTIYQPQLTWLGSIANRVTGAGLSVCEYHLKLCMTGVLRLTLSQCSTVSRLPTWWHLEPLTALTSSSSLPVFLK